MLCREQAGDITVLHSGMNLSSLIQTTSTHVVAGTLTGAEQDLIQGAIQACIYLVLGKGMDFITE